MGKIDFYGPIEGEPGVIMAFTKCHESLGFSKIVPSTARGFDIDSIDYNGQEVTVEFEYLSGNFITHRHQKQMIKSRKYVVVCWEDDCGLISKLKNEYGKQLHALLEMRKHISIKHTLPSNKVVKPPKYVVLAYNPKFAEMDFGEWSFSHCYRISTSKKTKKFAGDELPQGSKILFYRKGYIIGGCTVVRYEVINTPRKGRETKLYKLLTDYPASLYVQTEDDISSGILRGHIFYNDFFDIRDFKIKLSKYINKKMPMQGKIDITKEQYFNISGR